MKKQAILTVLVCIVFFLCSCGQSADKGSEWGQASKWEDMVLTKEEMLQDYDAIWEVYKESAPFLEVIARQHGSDYFDAVVEEYRQQIVSMKTVGDDSMLEFIIIVATSISEVCDIDGHAGIENGENYLSNLSAYRKAADEGIEIQPWLNTMDKAEVSHFYDYYNYLIEYMLEKNESLSEAKPEEQSDPKPAEEMDNLSIEILEEGKIGYIKVDSFDTSYMEEDIPRILTFLESIKDYEHLIIDIQGNGGGNTLYWEEAFACPNISEPVTTSFVRLIRDSVLSIKFYGSGYENTGLTVNDVKNNPAYTALQVGDMDGLAFAREESYILEPKFKEKLFGGKIWILVDPNVYSSAESFAVFCKTAGFATLVGKTTGGGNTGGAVMFELPNSHMLVNFDVEYAINLDGSCSHERGTVPDIDSEDPRQTVLDLISMD